MYLKWITSLVLSFYVGVLTVPFIPFRWSILIAWFISIIFIATEKRHHVPLQIILVSFLLCTMGIVRYSNIFNDSHRFELYSYLNTKVTVEGIVVTEPEQTEKGWRFTVETLHISTEEGEQDISHKLLIKSGFYPEYQFGDRIKMNGTLQVPESFESDNGRIFNYQMYLAKEKIFYIMNKPAIEVISNGNGSRLKSILFTLKHSFLDNVGSVLPEPQSALAGGLVLGVKQSLGKELEEMFRKAGLIHIVVLSGYNVTIIAESFIKTLSFLPKNIGTLFGAVGIFLFAIITGGTATVIRSSIMAIILLVSRTIGKDYDAYKALFVAGFFMVLHNPHILLYDPSFQLSFLATLGLMLLTPHLEPYFMWVTEKFGLRGIFTSTFATQIFVLPFILYQIGDLSIIGLIVNIIVLPIIPLTMLFVFLTGMAGFVFFPLSQLFSYFTYFLLAYEIKMVEVFASLPFASLSVNAFPIWIVFACYIIYAVVGWRIKKPL